LKLFDFHFSLLSVRQQSLQKLHQAQYKQHSPKIISVIWESPFILAEIGPTIDIIAKNQRAFLRRESHIKVQKYISSQNI
jgi:hypothetical protein